MKNTLTGLVFLSIVWLSSCGGSASSENITATAVTQNIQADKTITKTGDPATEPEKINETDGGTVVIMTKAMFLAKVYNYEKNPKQWNYIGDKPCIIDFYATWCRPCKMVAPLMEEFAAKYKGQIIIYKVDTDQERELAQFFGIRSIPTMFFCPAKGDPQMTQGALDKESYEKIINEVLLKNK